jgi:hypothetical protein
MAGSATSGNTAPDIASLIRATGRHCERSEAIHLSARAETWIASSLPLLAMTATQLVSCIAKNAGWMARDLLKCYAGGVENNFKAGAAQYTPTSGPRCSDICFVAFSPPFP